MTETSSQVPEGGVRGPERFASDPDPEQASGSLPRSAAAAVALLALLVGVPWLLWAQAGPPPLPTGLPDRADLTRPVDSGLVLAVLLAVVWLAWLQFAVCTVVEAVSLLRGGGLPRAVPLSGPSQAAARALVGTLLVGTSFLASTGAASAATSAPTTSADTAVTVVRSDGGSAADREQSAPEARDGDVAGDRVVRDRPAMAPVAGVPSDMTDVIGRKVAIVKPPSGHYHDNLWDIAERHLGDGRRWKEIFELNQGRQQPDGGQLVLGRLIQPGWVLIMPNDATGVERVTEAPAPQPAEDSAAPAQQGALTDGGTDAARDRVEGQQGGSTLARDLTGGGLLGAAVLTALLLERRRRRGDGSGLDPEELEAEVALRVGADLERAAWLDAALRSLSAACRSSQLPLPPVYAARVSDDRLALLVAGQQHQAPAGWSVLEDGRRWELERGESLPGGRAHAPYPGLVCLGRDDEGADVLVDLESADGVVTVEGSSTMAREVVAALAVQLATAPWSDDQRVHGHDLGEMLAGIGQERLELVEDLDELVAELSATGSRSPAEQVLAGRLGRTPGRPPHYVVLGSGIDDRLAERLAGSEGSRGLGVLAAGRLGSSRWRASVDDAGRLSLPLLGVEVDAVRLGAGSAALVAELFADAREQPPESDLGRPGVPQTPAGAGDDTAWRTARVRVGVLGELQLQAPGEVDPSRLALVSELVTFLALQTEPVHPSVVAASVWPLGVTADVRDATVARARDWLGTDPEGNHLLRETESGRLQLAPDVAVDWHAFCALARRSREASAREEPELLRRALQLVRGPVLDRAPARRFAWLVRTGIERQGAALVVDAAHRLAELEQHDPDGAAAAAGAGLRLAPHAQLLWRDLLVAESRKEDPASLPGAAERMLAVLEAAGVPVEAETEALLEELLPAHRERLG